MVYRKIIINVDFCVTELPTQRNRRLVPKNVFKGESVCERKRREERGGGWGRERETGRESYIDKNSTCTMLV